MPITALPVKKIPTIKGLTCTSLVRKRLSVGVCSAPAIPVKKATIKKAVDVMSGRRRAVAVDVDIFRGKPV